MNYKTVRIHEDTFQGLDKLSEKYNVTKTDLLRAMETYFFKTGISPLEPTDVTTEVKKLKNQLISFIKANEKEKINPMVEKVDLIVNTLLDFFAINSFDEHKKLANGLASFIEEKHQEIIKQISKNNVRENSDE